MFEVQSASGAAELTKVKWISPRGTLDVMDDFNLWVPIKMGYYRKAGYRSQPQPGRCKRQPSAGRGEADRHGLPVTGRAHILG
jgi:hypothetical protein